MDPRLCLIDGHELSFRAFFGVDSQPIDERAFLGQVAQRFANRLKTIHEALVPSHGAILFDAKLGDNERTGLDASYKANRRKTPALFPATFRLGQEICDIQGLWRGRVDGFEADDLIATLVSEFRDCFESVVIVGSDKDLHQLLGGSVTQWTLQEGFVDVLHVQEKFGVSIEQLVEYFALVGDRIDNIPGINGIGPKTARVLLQSYGRIDRVPRYPVEARGLTETQERSAGRILSENRTAIDLYKSLVTLRSDVPLDIDVKSLAWSSFVEDGLGPFFERHDLPYDAEFAG